MFVCDDTYILPQVHEKYTRKSVWSTIILIKQQQQQLIYLKLIDCVSIKSISSIIVKSHFILFVLYDHCMDTHNEKSLTTLLCIIIIIVVHSSALFYTAVSIFRTRANIFVS